MISWEEMLDELNPGGEKYNLRLMDGTTWLVSPGDLPTIATWIPTARIRVRQVEKPLDFNYELTNTNIGVSVHAMQIRSS